VTKKRKTLTARIPADLIDKIYKAEGWSKVEGEVRVRRCNALYNITRNRDDRYVATPKLEVEN
jgi:hypothetical protein